MLVWESYLLVQPAKLSGSPSTKIILGILYSAVFSTLLINLFKSHFTKVTLQQKTSAQSKSQTNFTFLQLNIVGGRKKLQVQGANL